MMILNELNNCCDKIMIEALLILHEFFTDIEDLDKRIFNLIADNKDNFNLLFEYNEDVLNTAELVEIKNFILCELERIESFND